MTQAEPKNWAEKHGSRAKGVEARLSQLQNSSRLAMHRFEEADDQSIFPQATLEHLHANVRAASIPQLLEDGKASLLSMTLLPTQKSKISFIPYNVMFLGNIAGYLFDMTADTPDPALAVRVFKESSNTGKDPTKKDFHMEKSSGVDALEGFYKGHDKNSLMKAAAQDPQLSAMQLDALGQSYGIKKNAEVQEINEILVAAKPKHLVGIFVPADEYPDVKYAASLHRVMACLSGLEHLKKGMDLPVVEYHVNAPHQGKFTYVAQGKEELEEAAKKAIVQLQKDSEFAIVLQKCKGDERGELCSPYDADREVYKITPALHEDVMRLLGVDIYKPLTLKSNRIEK